MGKSSIITIKENTSVILTEETTRLITMSPAHADYEQLDSKGNIVGINYCGEYKVNKNQVIDVNKSKHKVQRIEKIRHNGVKPAHYKLITSSALTKTFNFIMPLLGANRTFFRFNTQFINAYIGTETDADYGDSIYLLYKFSGSIEFTNFEATLVDHPWYKDTIDVDKYQVLYKFNVPEEHKMDVGLIIKGKYSRISVKTKERILRFHNAKETSTLGKILSRSKELKKAMEKDLLLEKPIPDGLDLHTPFKPEEEIFRDYLRLDNSKLRE